MPAMLKKDLPSKSAKSTRRSQRRPRKSANLLTASSESDTSQDHFPPRPVLIYKPGSSPPYPSRPSPPTPDTCPVPSCDSLGHLGGRLPRHTSTAGCPLYHRAVATLGRHVADVDLQPSLDDVASPRQVATFAAAQAAASEAVEQNVANTIRAVRMGKYTTDVLYPGCYPTCDVATLHVCEFCLQYRTGEAAMARHVAKCPWQYPPGDEVYREGNVSVWQIDGRRQTRYCVDLCRLARLFIGLKTVTLNVGSFVFYVLTIADEDGCHMVGYFSKERLMTATNMSCLLTLPAYQRQGYGRLLIDFSYVLLHMKNRTGSPEKPLSDVGFISFRKYWTEVLFDQLAKLETKEVSIQAICRATGVDPLDMVGTLQVLGLVKYWRGMHIIIKRQDRIDQHLKKKAQRPYRQIDLTLLDIPPI